MMLNFFRKGVLRLSFFLLAIPFTQSQNLVPNGDFEEYYNCPTDADQFDGYIKNWYNPTSSFSSYFNSCSDTSLCSVPYNYYGYNLAHSGNGYACFIAFSYFFQERNYVSVKLTDTLQNGIEYCIGFYLNLPNSTDYYKGSRFATDNISVFLSDTAIQINTLYLIPVIPQINIFKSTFYTDTLNWMLCYAKYTANGGEEYITIGNFDEDSLTNYSEIENCNNWGTLYYIDDAFVYKCDDVSTAEAGEDVHICLGDSVQLGVQTEIGYKYKWLPSTFLSNDTIANPYASPTQTTTYYLYHNKYIQTIDSVTVFVENCGISIPNAFTPNGDGINDFFKPKDLNFKEISGKIFNRWGQELYNFVNPSDSWDGKYKGNDVSEGVYFYVIRIEYFDGTTETKTGSIELLR